MSAEKSVLRSYTDGDEAAALELWRRTWQLAYPDIDFAARLDWWTARWRSELVPKTTIIVAESNGSLKGFVTVDAAGYLDQIVVAPEAQGNDVGARLLDAAKEISPAGLDLHVNEDNHRAISFYQKHGFVISGADVNPRSGAPVHKMSWRA